MKQATVFAPATVANVAVGFDVLGLAVDSLGDTVTVTKTDRRGITVSAVSNPKIPTDAKLNTATAGLIKMASELGLGFGFDVRIEKGIPLSSGIGGSAASAVGAVMAAAELLEVRPPREQLLRYALEGEFVASGAIHADNAAPCLYGGLTIARMSDPMEIIQVPVPDSLLCVLVHPHLEIQTKAARAILKKEIPLASHVRQSANLASFLAACFRGDLELLKRSFEDVLIEPQRASLIPKFMQAKAAALENGALGFSISGSGPTVFALADSISAATDIETAVLREFKKDQVKASSWVSKINKVGAHVLRRG